MKIPTAPTTEDSSSARSEQYSKLFETPHGMLPDPAELDGWLSEQDAVKSWPPTMAFDIGKYLQNIDNIPLRDRLMSDYKDGKAYSYFASGWVKDIHYHNISEDSKLCFLKAECRPSQNVSNVPWNVWVSIWKKTGEIHSAYCTCFAGFSGTCNHVAAILFKVDFAWRNGITNPACTSRECEWAAFGAKLKLEPKRVSEMKWSKPQFSKSGDTSEEGINPTARRLFSPVAARSTSHSTSKPALGDLIANLAPTFSGACVWQYCGSTDIDSSMEVVTNYAPSDDINLGLSEEVSTSCIPEPLITLASRAPSVDQFLECIPIYTASAVEELEMLTRGQSNNQQWFEQRKGRITGSVVHSVLTRSRKLMAGDQIDNTALLRRLLYKTSSLDLSAMKYGREMEPEARQKYTKLMKEFGHKQVCVTDCGLFIDPDLVYLGASPDGLVSCPCCGLGVLEIKCPSSISHTIPGSENLDYIAEDESGLFLKRSHMYYTQVQMQMGVTKRPWCDFFVYTRHGYIRTRVLFNQEAWLEIRESCKYFFHNHLAREMVLRSLAR